MDASAKAGGPAAPRARSCGAGASKDAGPRVAIGQFSTRGRKDENQDFYGACVPADRLSVLKGVCAVIADGISTSRFGRIAAESAVRSFLTDYYCTPESLSVKASGHCVAAAANTWLHAQTARSHLAHDRDRGYVCTFSALVVKARRAHLFHVGDSRIWRLHGGTCEQLTHDHRLVLSSEESYLTRALGLSASVEIEYRELDVRAGDVFVLSTDGAHEHVAPRDIARAIDAREDLDAAARQIAETALRNGSPDNVTLQIVRIDATGGTDASGFLDRADTLPPPPIPRVGAELDGFRILRELHVSHRSHIYLAADVETGARVALKLPSLDLRDDPAYLRRFAMEDWIARRIESPHVVAPAFTDRDRSALYVVTEHLEGQTLRQWMTDNPHPELETVRSIAEQIAKGLRAFHRRGMLHQDLRPENVMIDADGTVKIIDFGCARVDGVLEASPDSFVTEIPGTTQYAAPEYFLGMPGNERSDLFSLGVITYELITGRLPYGARASRAWTAKAQSRLRYVPAEAAAYPVPPWIDAALKRAVRADPRHRHEALSEFTADLRRPNPAYARGFVPLAERDPVRFWQAVSIVLALVVTYLVVAD
ncbi:MAG: bifunctional protein-serine/threonine kinase/phosphatase [Gammaproteobacteria bacterium]|nr:bifunctional protein-serine/threonine kinase/phosphatase [Gammaproteobacteria bacterium]